MFVDGLPEGRGTEVGHKHFQHARRGTKEFGPDMDRFSFIVLDVSLEALQVDPSLHRRFREGGQAIIFKANDFADPSMSEVFHVLNASPTLREARETSCHLRGTSPQCSDPDRLYRWPKHPSSHCTANWRDVETDAGGLYRGI